MLNKIKKFFSFESSSIPFIWADIRNLYKIAQQNTDLRNSLEDRIAKLEHKLKRKKTLDKDK